MERGQEFETKLGRVRALLHGRGCAAALFATDQGFAWLGCGAADLVEHTAEAGRAFGNLLVTDSRCFLLANNIEIERILTEEMKNLPVEPVSYDWTDGTPDALLRDLVGSGTVVSDVPLSGIDTAGCLNFQVDKEALGLLRTPLTEGEIERFRVLGRLSAGAMQAVAAAVKPGMSEHEIAGSAGREVLIRGAFPTLILVGVDERIRSFRHPVPTEARLDRYCMIVVCAKKWGLVSSITRLIHFGRLTEDLMRRYDALCMVEADLIAATRPGAAMAGIFAEGSRSYARAGFPGEEKRHFQGGTCGYYSREHELSPREDYRVCDPEVFAHNPTIAGVKMEDTILVNRDGYEVLTEMQEWPTRRIRCNGSDLRRPEILVRLPRGHAAS